MTIDNHPFALIADDIPKFISYYKKELLNRHNVSTISATTLSMLYKQFDKYIDSIDVIILDGCIPGSTLNTLGFIEYARRSGFTKPIIAASSLPYYRELMLDAGCSHEAEKEDAPFMASRLVARVV